MVRAILEGRKTQTRRVIKPQPDDTGLHNHTDYPMSIDSKLEGWIGTVEETGETKEYGLKYYPGDVLWVRETFQYRGLNGNLIGFRGENGNSGFLYKEKDAEYQKFPDFKWVPSIYMPKEAARIWLEIVSVKVERLQDISEQDALAEGIETTKDPDGHDCVRVYGFKENMFAKLSQFSAIESFESLWKSINGLESLEANPWVWVVEFKRIEKPTS